MTVDPNTEINNGTRIPEDPAAVAAAHGTNVANDIPPETSAAGALRVPDTTLHRQTARGQVPPSLQ